MQVTPVIQQPQQPQPQTKDLLPPTFRIALEVLDSLTSSAGIGAGAFVLSAVPILGVVAGVATAAATAFAWYRYETSRSTPSPQSLLETIERRR